jgi:hypothetical protein
MHAHRHNLAIDKKYLILLSDTEELYDYDNTHDYSETLFSSKAISVYPLEWKRTWTVSFRNKLFQIFNQTYGRNKARRKKSS